MRRCTQIACLLCVLQKQASASKMLRFSSPLQSFTIPDIEMKDKVCTNRENFLQRFRSGLQAEVATRRELSAKRSVELQAAARSESSWSEGNTASRKSFRAAEDAMIEQAFDSATADFEKKGNGALNQKSKNMYQFVGVVSRKARGKPITWYAREKPTKSTWSIRLVHVNEDAVVKDLFNRGKVDIFGRYKNTGRVDSETNGPIVASSYEVRQRSWKNLWNFSPHHFFSDPSGMYWRERRLPPGLYTDGVAVYESSYRYGDGRNGMHRVSGLKQFLSSKSMTRAQKENILTRLREGEPDVVLEL